jgi:large subunit ribosomal protein L23
VKQIVIKPRLTEKTTRLAEKANAKQYVFDVALESNKVEIKKAIEEQFSVQVQSIRTSILPSKPKNRMQRGRYLTGRTSKVKKAYITLVGDQAIDFFKNV